MTHDLCFAFEWEEAAGVRAPDLAATWARLEIRVGEETVTQVEERATGSSRRSIYCSLLPLAEWVVFNWWFLFGHRRPHGTPTGLREWATNSRLASWYDRHNFRAAGEGMLWPNLSVVPKGALTWIAWVADEPSDKRIRFVKTGDAWVPAQQVETALTALVEAVLTRLDEQGVDDTQLATEWRAIRQTDAPEREFCLASAALGLDPYSLDEDEADAILAVAEALPAEEAQDVFDAVSAERLLAVLAWVDESRAESRGLAPTDRVDLRALGASAKLIEVNGGLPWLVGWEQARRVRDVLGVGADQRLDVSAYFSVLNRPSPDIRLVGVGAWTDDTASLVLGRELTSPSERFARARAAWHVMAENDPARFLLTAGQANRNRIERAFAAELLAPAEGIRVRLEEAADTVTDEELDGLAAHFEVSSRLIAHQVDNQLTGLFT